jgi:thiaminase/transcriptional activator TenA
MSYRSTFSFDAVRQALIGLPLRAIICKRSLEWCFASDHFPALFDSRLRILIHFSRARALAVIKSETLEEMRHCAGTVNALINDEIDLHIKICADVGITEHALFNAQERSGNLAYTLYVLDAGHSGVLLDLLAAPAPEYQQVCGDVGLLLDNAVRRRLGSDPEHHPRWKGLCKCFEIATRLENGFWDMGLAP